MHPTLESLGLPSVRHHLFLCLGPNCCARAVGEACWLHLKQRLKDLGLPAFRSKADCLRVCEGGPILLVYPEGIWYGGITPERIDRVLHEHLQGGRPVEEWIIARHPLPNP